MLLPRSFRVLSVRAYTTGVLTTTHEPWFRVAVDGPAGAGKSTTARALAGRLGFGYIDSGAMYRAVTFEALRELLDPKISRHHPKIVDVARRTVISFPTPTTVMLNNQIDVTQSIRLDNIVEAVSVVAAIPEVRTILLERQRAMARGEMPHLLPFTEGFTMESGKKVHGVVMDGRDIGSTVLPDAELKIYLTAKLTVRAERRLEEMRLRNPNRAFQNLESMEKKMKLRDEADLQRAVSPLVRAAGSIRIDSSEMSFEDQVGVIERMVMERVKPWLEKMKKVRK